MTGISKAGNVTVRNQGGREILESSDMSQTQGHLQKASSCAQRLAEDPPRPKDSHRWSLHTHSDDGTMNPVQCAEESGKLGSARPTGSIQNSFLPFLLPHLRVCATTKHLIDSNAPTSAAPRATQAISISHATICPLILRPPNPKSKMSSTPPSFTGNVKCYVCHLGVAARYFPSD